MDLEHHQDEEATIAEEATIVSVYARAALAVNSESPP